MNVAHRSKAAVVMLGMAGALSFAGVAAQAQQTPRVAPVARPLPVQPAFSFDNKKVRLSLSGIACRPDATGTGRCLAAFDEGTRAQFATLDEAGLHAVGRTFELVRSGKELDAEAVALDGAFVYVSGSHSVKRSNCKANETGRQVVRMRVPWMTNPAGTSTPEASDLQASGRLWKLMKAQPGLRNHAGGCLDPGQKNPAPQPKAKAPGLDIEGMAARNGRLYFGFRGPSIAGSVPVFSVMAEGLFGNAPPDPKLMQLSLGEGLGIRDMVAVDAGFLLLVGPDDQDTPTPTWYVVSWPEASSSTVRRLAELDLRPVEPDVCAKSAKADIKPEAITVLAQHTDGYRVAILSDGLCDGGPLLFDLAR